VLRGVVGEGNLTLQKLVSMRGKLLDRVVGLYVGSGQT